jgi:hypothetical protein
MTLGAKNGDSNADQVEQASSKDPRVFFVPGEPYELIPVSFLSKRLDTQALTKLKHHSRRHLHQSKDGD